MHEPVVLGSVAFIPELNKRLPPHPGLVLGVGGEQPRHERATNRKLWQTAFNAAGEVNRSHDGASPEEGINIIRCPEQEK